MSNLSAKLNLAGLTHAVRNEKGKDGGEVECLIIPIDKNFLYRGEKGLYLDLSLIEVKNRAEGIKDTHLIKQSLPKEVYESLTEEQRKSYPILGNAIEWKQSSEAPLVEVGQDDDLPF